MFHSSFILRAGGGGGGGGGGAGFAGEITESRWIIQYSHRSECSLSTDEPNGVSMEKKNKIKNLKIPAGHRRFSPLLPGSREDAQPTVQPALSRSHVSWKINRLGVKCVLLDCGLTHVSLAPKHPACCASVIT